MTDDVVWPDFLERQKVYLKPESVAFWNKVFRKKQITLDDLEEEG